MPTSTFQVRVHEGRRGALSMRVTGVAEAQCKPLADTVAEATSILHTLPDMPMVRESARKIANRFVGRCSYSRDYRCSICEKSARSADEIFHAPSCDLGNLLRALKGGAL